MRICYIADAASPHTQKWASHFAREFDVHVLSFRPATIPGVQVHHLGLLQPLGKPRYPLQVPESRRLLRRIDPAFVHALDLTSYGFIAALSGRHPLITSVWGHDVLQAPHKTPLHFWITRYALRKADIVTATGHGLAAATRPYMPKGAPIHVVPYGIDLRQFEPSSTNGRAADAGRVIGCVKALDPEKGFQYLVGAMPAILARYPKTRLLLVGDGPERGRLERQARELAISDSVTFAGEVPHADVPQWMRKIDIFVQPSLSESFGVSALEASACAIPVVATAVEGGRDIVRDGETGLLVPPANSDALASAIIRLLDEPSLQQKVGAAGRRFVAEQYDWYENAARMAKIYERALELGHARN